MQTPLVSVIVPCYNQDAFVSDALQSVLAQTYANWECIVVNDGSTDNTAEVINQWARKDHRFKPLHLENGGVSRARNEGIAIAKGHYILPLDGDDKIAADYIAKLVVAMQSDLELKLVYGACVKFGVVNEKWELPEYSYQWLIVTNMIHCTGLYRKSDFDALDGGYDTNMHEGLEDWEFWIHFLKNGGKVKRIDDAVFYYRVKAESRMTGITLARRYRLLAYIYQKHPELYEHFINDPSITIKIDFPYSFYLSALKYASNDRAKIARLREYFNKKLGALLANRGFFKKKRLLCQWYRRGKLNLTFWDVLIR
jgi:glycosyltransferase involved in cell wall biosynthesis